MIVDVIYGERPRLVLRERSPNLPSIWGLFLPEARLDLLEPFKPFELKQDLSAALAEMGNNAFHARRQVVETDIEFAVEANQAAIGMTSSLVVAILHNVALDTHAARAKRIYDDMRGMVIEEVEAYREARQSECRRLETKDRGWVKVDKNGLPHNGSAFGLPEIRCLCDVFRISILPHPPGFDSHLRIVRTVMGVPNHPPVTKRTLGTL